MEESDYQGNRMKRLHTSLKMISLQLFSGSLIVTNYICKLYLKLFEYHLLAKLYFLFLGGGEEEGVYQDTILYNLFYL